MTITNMKQEIQTPGLEDLCKRVAQLEVENMNLRQERDDLKRAEEQLRTVVDNARDIVFQYNPTERITKSYQGFE
jgi:PAS domain-containing protein